MVKSYGFLIWMNEIGIFQYNSEGKLHYNPKIFDDFFYIFSLEQKQYQILLKKVGLKAVLDTQLTKYHVEV